MPRVAPGVDGPSLGGFTCLSSRNGCEVAEPPPLLAVGAVGSLALIWPHPDPLILDSLVVSHSLDIKAPPGRHRPVLGIQGSPETSRPPYGGRTALCFQMRETRFPL